MCRFIVYRGPEVSLRTVVFGGSHPLVRQAWAPRELLVGRINADGYGLVWYHQGGTVRIARREPIWYDPDLERLLETQRSRTVVASLRNATPGMSVGAGGVAPLVVGSWCFALNGFVRGFHRGVKRRIHERLTDGIYRHLRDGSDTEALFLLALQAVEDGAGPGAALVHVIRTVRALLRQDAGRASGDGGAQLNMILSDATRTAVSRASSVDATNSLYRADDPSLFPGATVVASEPLDDDGWRPVEPQTVLEIGPDESVEVLQVPR